MNEQEWEEGMRSRIHTFAATMHHRKGITISKAQEIFGEFTDADALLRTMASDKLVFQSPLNRDDPKWEFTHLGLMLYFRQHYDAVEEKLGHPPDEQELYEGVLQISKENSV